MPEPRAKIRVDDTLGTGEVGANQREDRQTGSVIISTPLRFRTYRESKAAFIFLRPWHAQTQIHTQTRDIGVFQQLNRRVNSSDTCATLQAARVL